ncbi:hypothetical protein CTAYLR_008115 [Chrysophaeum taylorii]|uniref:Pectin acetylesterase n=1 Tax=Chrysophaeum taylorii TaxID=2483200 RepID=A0AAD7UJY9_9STRA|nr:hypothetical protein CTAYLR_008115 [Chrysophaeum taylorii]
MIRGFLLVASVSAWSCNDEGATTVLRQRSLADPLAVCNDGSPASYYFREGSAKKWLVYLAGGGECWDEVSCEMRENGTAYPYHDCATSSVESPCFMSSKDYPAACNKTGIFSANASENPALAGATVAYLPYCTSDAHVGDAAFGRWQFRGRRVVAALVRDLESLGMGREGTTVVFGGGSAGARGAMLWLDALDSFEVHGFLDSPYYLDLRPYAASFVGFPEISEAARRNFNVTVDDRCARAYFQDVWKCTMGQYALPFVRTRRLVVAAQFDSWQLSNAVLGYDGIVASPNLEPGPELDYVLAFGAATRSLLFSTTTEGPKFSTACWSHHQSESASFWTAQSLDNATQASALSAFLHLNAEDAPDHIDTCAGFDCGRCG